MTATCQAIHLVVRLGPDRVRSRTEDRAPRPPRGSSPSEGPSRDGYAKRRGTSCGQRSRPGLNLRNSGISTTSSRCGSSPPRRSGPSATSAGRSRITPEEAAAHGAVYIEGIFTPVGESSGGASWDEVFTGFCDGAPEAKDRFGMRWCFTPDTPRNFGLESQRRRPATRSSTGIGGLWGSASEAPRSLTLPSPSSRAFLLAKDGGIGSVPHAGEVAGAESVIGAIEALGADRIQARDPC